MFGDLEEMLFKLCWHECSNAEINQACYDLESIKTIVMLFLV